MRWTKPRGRPPTPPRPKLARWRNELAAAFDGGRRKPAQGRRCTAGHPVRSAARRRSRHVIEGVEMDSAIAATKPSPTVRGTCIRVASAVGLICLEIFGYRDPRARQYATDLGVALQLTNILRDVPGDLAQGRRLYPARGSQPRTAAPRRTWRRECGRRARRALATDQGAAAAAGHARARVLPRAQRPACRGRTHAGWSPPRSWARSTGGILDRIEARRLRRVQPRRPHPAAAACADCGNDVGANGRWACDDHDPS